MALRVLSVLLLAMFVSRCGREAAGGHRRVGARSVERDAMDGQIRALRRVPAARRRADVALCHPSDRHQQLQGGHVGAGGSAAGRRRAAGRDIPRGRAIAGPASSAST